MVDPDSLEKLRKIDSKVHVETPIEIIDFINNSINEILQTEFGKDINSKDIHILDPFAGEAQFTARGIDTGTITKETAGRIEHYEVIPERAEQAIRELEKRGVINPDVKNVDTMEQ